MLDGLADDEVDDFLDDHPTTIPLFEINAIPTIESHEGKEVTEETLPQEEPDPTNIAELRQARDAFERELAISQRVKASTLETINLDRARILVRCRLLITYPPVNGHPSYACSPITRMSSLGPTPI